MGCYYMSIMRDGDAGQGMTLRRHGLEVEHALAEKAISLHSKIKYRYDGVDADGKPMKKWYDTTPGRVMFNEILPRNPKTPFYIVNKLMTKREISATIDHGAIVTAAEGDDQLLDDMMPLGFHNAPAPVCRSPRTT